MNIVLIGCGTIGRTIVEELTKEGHTLTIIDEDKNIAMQIEQYIKKKEILDQQERDQAEADAKGLEYVEISDEELMEHKQWIEEQKEKDMITLLGEEGDM
jgi:prephenate dehydrogenase